MNATALARPALRVTAKDCGAGFFALLIYALNQLIYAESHGYAAHVDFGERCRDGRRAGGDGGARGEAARSARGEPAHASQR